MLICPIVREMMIDPVLVVETGNTYERESIEEWFQDHATDPLTNVALETRALAPNNLIRSEARPPPLVPVGTLLYGETGY